VLKKIFTRTSLIVQKSSHHWWFIWLFALMAFADLFIVIFPVDWFIIATTLIKKRKGLEMALACALGSALGAVALAYLSQLYGLSVIEYFSKGITNTTSWARTTHQVDTYGAWALTLISAGPLPQHPAIVLCGLAFVEPYKIFLAVLIARTLKYCFFVWAAINAPGVLKGLGLHKK
jgi:membrane protein YqaA with SNARE-associated domain